VVTVPAAVWRVGSLYRGVALGLPVGLCLGAMAWLDSGVLLGGVIALVITGLLYGILMPRRMAQYWPGADQLSGEERVTVVRTARRGERIEDPRLAQAVIDYAKGIHAAAEKARPFRWVLPLVLVVSIATAVWDSVYGSWGNAVASGIYLLALLIELLWWPKRRDQMLADADRAAGMAGQPETSD
jgi:hypothetical protein